MNREKSSTVISRCCSLTRSLSFLDARSRTSSLRDRRSCRHFATSSCEHAVTRDVQRARQHTYVQRVCSWREAATRSAAQAAPRSP